MLLLADPAVSGDYFEFDCATEATETTEADGDYFVECNDPVALLGGDLTWDASMTLFAGDYRGIVGRLVYELTNSTGSDLTLDLRYEMDTEECDGGAGNITTSSGDVNTDTDDAWLLCNNDNNALEAHAWGNTWMTSFTNDNSDNLTEADIWDIDSDGFVLGAGETVTLVFFIYSEGTTDHSADFGDTDANITTRTQGYFDLTTLGSSHLWENLTTAANWTGVEGSEPAAEEPSLPNTGVDASGLLLAGAALLGLGAVIVVRRRSAQA